MTSATRTRPRVRRGTVATEPGTDYLSVSRHPAVAWVSVVPLLLLYEVGRGLHKNGEYNAAEWLLADGFHRLIRSDSSRLPLVIIAAVSAIVAFTVVVVRRMPCFRYCPLIALEGALYGACLGPAALYLADGFGLAQGAVANGVAANGAGGPERTLATEVLAAIGAGVYEEILFRMGLLSALAFVMARAAAGFGLPRISGHVTAVLLSALLFALFHHLGPDGEPMDAWRMIFRTAAGVLLGGLFIVRGFGVVVWCHTAYDVFFFWEARS